MSQYLDFVDLKYTPSKDDLIALFRFEPNRISTKEAVGRIASESSNGTWTKLTTLKEHIRKIRARAFWIKGNYVKVAYPSVLFELGSMPQIYSAICGNIFGMKELKNLRLEDVSFPKKIVDSFRGPLYSINEIRRFMKVFKRPLTATVPKPKVGMTAEEHAQVAYDAWVGGIDFLKDDENLTNQKFNRFKDRVKACAKMRDLAEKETGERKDYFINITAETEEMIKRAKFAKNYDFKYIMVDIVTAGWAGLQSVRNYCENSKQAIHAHRAMHATFDRNPKHGISMLMLAKSARLVGVNNIHVGTAIGKLVSPKDEVLALKNEMVENKIKENLKNHILEQNWFGKKNVFAVSSGGLSPLNVPFLMKHFGNDLIIQMGGGIHGHPNGTKDGAKSARQAIDAVMEKKSLKEYAKTHKELREALRHRWK